MTASIKSIEDNEEIIEKNIKIQITNPKILSDEMNTRLRSGRKNRIIQVKVNILMVCIFFVRFINNTNEVDPSNNAIMKYTGGKKP